MHLCLCDFVSPIFKKERACKPGSVPLERGDGHLSGKPVARLLMQPTRDFWRCGPHRGLYLVPYLALLRAGFARCSISGDSRGLLHRDFTLTRLAAGGIVSVALSVGSLRPGVTGRLDSVELGLSSL